MPPHQTPEIHADESDQRQASVSGLLRYVHAARQFNVDADGALATIGLQQGDLHNAQLRLPISKHERLLMELVRLSGDALFGLRAGLIVQPDAWSVLGYILINSASLGDAMTRVISYEKLIGEMGSSQIESREGRICMSWHARVKDPLTRRHMVENVLASWFSFGQWAADTDRTPFEVTFEHAMPAGVDLADYQQAFGCAVHFGRPQSGIVIDQDMLSLSLRQPDASLLKTLELHAQKQLTDLDSPGQSWKHRVRRELRQQLQDGIINRSEIALRLGVSARTLQRYLRSEGTHYQQVLDELRQAQATGMLADPGQSYADIAQALGFLEAASFHRRFKAWTGMTPGEYREQSLSELDNIDDLNR